MTGVPSLGRGLAALLETGAPELSKGTALKGKQGSQTVPIGQLTGGKFQPRNTFDTHLLEELASSIQKQGILQPILVRPLKQSVYPYEIVAGERRWQAAKMAGLQEIPVYVCSLTDQEALEVALVENIQRADLNALEEAEGYKRLSEEFGYTQEQIAKSVGKSRSQISNTLRLLTLPESIKHQVRQKNLSASHARALVGVEDPEKLGREIIDHDMSVRDLEKRLLIMKKGQETPPTPSKNPDISYLEAELTQHLKARVTLKEKGTGVALNVTFTSHEHLDSFIQKVCD